MHPTDSTCCIWSEYIYILNKETKNKKMRKSKRKTMEIKKRIGGGTSAARKVRYQARGGNYFVRLSKIK